MALLRMGVDERNIGICVDGLDAYEYISNASFNVDCVFLDIEMPRMNGFEAITSIRSFIQDRNKSMPLFAAMTGHVLDEETKKRFDDVGFNGWFDKPMNFSSIYDFLKRVSTTNLNTDA